MSDPLMSRVLDMRPLWASDSVHQSVLSACSLLMPAAWSPFIGLVLNTMQSACPRWSAVLVHQVLSSACSLAQARCTNND